jgi:hypothetical protein
MRWGAIVILLVAPCALAQQINANCIDRAIDMDSYRLEPLRSSEIADRDAILEAVSKNVDHLLKIMTAENDSPEMIEWRAETDKLNLEGDNLAVAILAAHDVTFGPDDNGHNYGTFLNTDRLGIELYGLDADRKFVAARMAGNFLLIYNFTEKPCGIQHATREYDDMVWSDRQ